MFYQISKNLPSNSNPNIIPIAPSIPSFNIKIVIHFTPRNQGRSMIIISVVCIYTYLPCSGLWSFWLFFYLPVYLLFLPLLINR